MIPEFSLQDKTALVVGGSRGIGSGIVEVLLEAGATVTVNSLTDTYAKPFSERLSGQYPGKVFKVLSDATTPEGCEALAKETLELVGDIDILVNCVGDGAFTGSLAALPDGKTKRYSDADIEMILGLNLMSALYATRAVAQNMIERRSGKIINLASLAAFHGAAKNSVYAVGKAGIVGLTKSLAKEWGPYGICVNGISPGVFLDYEVMSKDEIETYTKMFEGRVPMGRLGKFRDVGLLALYLSSSASDYLTGQVISIDGGLAAG